MDSPDAFGSTYDTEACRPDALWESRLRAAASSGRDLALFAEVNGEVCGMAWCKIAEADPGAADVFQMWVAPERRRRGIGKAMLDEALAWAAAAGVRVMRLGVTTVNRAALRFYREHGFVPVGSPVPLKERHALAVQDMSRTIGEPDASGAARPSRRAPAR